MRAQLSNSFPQLQGSFIILLAGSILIVLYLYYSAALSGEYSGALREQSRRDGLNKGTHLEFQRYQSPLR